MFVLLPLLLLMMMMITVPGMPTVSGPGRTITRVPGTFENKELVVVVHDVHCCFKKKSVTNEARERKHNK